MRFSLQREAFLKPLATGRQRGRTPPDLPVLANFLVMSKTAAVA
jgi:hypothetical protein